MPHQDKVIELQKKIVEAKAKYNKLKNDPTASDESRFKALEYLSDLEISLDLITFRAMTEHRH